MSGPGYRMGQDPTAGFQAIVGNSGRKVPVNTFSAPWETYSPVRGSSPNGKRGVQKAREFFLRNWQSSRHSGASRTLLELKVFVPGIKQYFFLEGKGVLPLGSRWWDPGMETWGKGLRTRE